MNPINPCSFYLPVFFRTRIYRIDADASLGGRYCLPAQFTIYATKQPKTHNRQPIFIYFYLLIFSHTRNPPKKTGNRFAGRHFLYNFVPLKYVDVILPLGIDALYTYSVPDDMEQKVVPYVRVKVPLGITKTYTAIVVSVADTLKNGIEPEKVKPIVAVIDAHPVLLSEQYRLWTWIASYYMSPIGDVYRCALPTGMKTEGIYRAKTETFVGLSENYHSEQAIHQALNSLVRAPKQLAAFNAFLALTHWDTITGESTEMPVAEITREALMNETHSNIATIKGLCDKEILRLYDKAVGRLNESGTPHPENIKPLNENQQRAYDEIRQQWEKHNVCLLHGVTSSGKTEIYISMIQRAIDEGKQVMYLLPRLWQSPRNLPFQILGCRARGDMAKAALRRTLRRDTRSTLSRFPPIPATRTGDNRRRARDLLQAAGPSATLSRTVSGYSAGTDVWGKDTSRHGNAKYGVIL